MTVRNVMSDGGRHYILDCSDFGKLLHTTQSLERQE